VGKNKKKCEKNRACKCEYFFLEFSIVKKKKKKQEIIEFGKLHTTFAIRELHVLFVNHQKNVVGVIFLPLTFYHKKQTQHFITQKHNLQFIQTKKVTILN
jgi:hypothetical protein